MSKSIKVDENNNLIFGENWIVCQGNESLTQDIRNLLNLWIGEYPFDITKGVDYLELLKTNNLEMLINQIEDIIIEDNRVSSTNVSYNQLGNGDDIELKIKIKTNEGDIVYV